MENNNGDNVPEQNNESAGGFKKFMIRLGIVFSWPVFQVVRPLHKSIVYPYECIFDCNRDLAHTCVLGLFTLLFFPIAIPFWLVASAFKFLKSFVKTPFKICRLIRAVGNKGEYLVTHKYATRRYNELAPEAFNGSFKQTIGILSGVYRIKSKPKPALDESRSKFNLEIHP